MTNEPQPDSYPLSWPHGQPRTLKREAARFRGHTERATEYTDHTGARRTTYRKDQRPLTVAESTARLRDELRRLGASNVTVSTNVPLRRDGEPVSGRRDPDDPGVAVYFSLKNDDGSLMPVCFPCDAFTRVADNLAAVAGHISALRAQERYRVGTRAQVYAGFRSLPAKGETSRSSWQVLRLPVPTGVGKSQAIELVQTAFKKLALSVHPDMGGSRESWDELQRARDDALREVGSWLDTGK